MLESLASVGRASDSFHRRAAPGSGCAAVKSGTFRIQRAPLLIMPSTDEQDSMVLMNSAKDFRSHGETLEHFLLFLAEPPTMFVVHPISEGASYAETAWIAPAIRKLARDLKIRALYRVAEAWVSNNDVYSAEQGSEPRFDPERREQLLVIAEHPEARPPMRVWSAAITRDQNGVPTLGEWRMSRRVNKGRATYLLPPEAYGRGGSA